MEPKCIIPLNKAIFRLLRFFSLFKRYKTSFRNYSDSNGRSSLSLPRTTSAYERKFHCEIDSITSRWSEKRQEKQQNIHKRGNTRAQQSRHGLTLTYDW